jgi:monovalent cation:H+ antiporter-2, CPA2 family
MERTLITDMIVLLWLAIFIVYVSHRIRLPSIVGFLLTGVVVGPYGIRLIQDVQEVELLAEIGIILLLFSIGIEFSYEKLLQLRRYALQGGFVQLTVTAFAGTLLALPWVGDLGQAIFFGFLLTHSSTAIILKIMQERGDLDTPHCQSSLGISLFQDISSVPMILLVPLLAGQATDLAVSLLVIAAKGVGIFVLLYVLGRWVIPSLFYRVVRIRNQTLFLLFVIALCFTIAWLTASVGLSLALGAFLAGLIISETEYSHQALGHITPFREVFSSFFFISVGMLLDVSFLLNGLGLVVLVAVGVFLLKTLIGVIANLSLKLPLRTSLLSGLAIGQVGEFSFILANIGMAEGLIDATHFQAFLSVAILTMALVPFVIKSAPYLSDLALRLPMRRPRALETESTPLKEGAGLRDHMIIIGFGVTGRNVTRAAEVAEIPHVIIEMNPETVREELKNKRPILYGDAGQESVLDRAGLSTARILIVAINDPNATRTIIATVRRLRPNVYVIVRSRYLQEVESLFRLGANEVIPEDFETSVEIFTRVLTKYLVPRQRIERLVAEIRAGGYAMLRSPTSWGTSMEDLRFHVSELEVEVLEVTADSFLAGRSLAELDLRNRNGVTVLAIRRAGQVLSNPTGADVLSEGDFHFCSRST